MTSFAEIRYGHGGPVPKAVNVDAESPLTVEFQIDRISAYQIDP